MQNEIYLNGPSHGCHVLGVHAKGRQKLCRGFVLMATLFAIVFCSLLLMGVSRSSKRIHDRINLSEQQLKYRWGQLTLEHTVLCNARALLGRDTEQALARNANNQIGYPSRMVSVKLNGIRWMATLSDEQAKVNLGTLLQNTNISFLTSWMEKQGLGENARIRPLDVAGNPSLDRLESWGQVYDLSQIKRNQIGSFLAQRTKWMTLWGRGGRLNYSVAGENALKTIAELALSREQARQWSVAVSKDRSAPLTKIAGELGLSQRSLDNLNRLMTRQSSCFAVWTVSGIRDDEVRGAGIPRSDHRSATRYRLAVREEISRTQSRKWVFQW